MSDITQREYHNEVESTAMTVLDKIEEYPEDYDDEYEAVFETIDGHSYVTWNSNFLDVLRHSRSEPQEWQVYVEDDETNHWKVLGAMAYTSFRADVYEELRTIREAREKLGEATNLIGDHKIWDEGVEFEFVYKSGYGVNIEEETYTLKSASRRGNEWAVIDPEGNHFEMISPSVMVENDSTKSPAKAFLNRLENICSIREHERGDVATA